MKRDYLSSAAMVLLVISSGCSELLDLKPENYVSEDDVFSLKTNPASILTGVYSVFNNPEIYGGSILKNAELLGGDGEIALLNEEQYYEPYQIFSKTVSPSNNLVLAHWSNSYRVINTVNNILYSMEEGTLQNDSRVKREAYFLRALMYFDLVSFFALPYEQGQANTQPGVPLMLKPVRLLNKDVFIGRSSVQEVYDQIIKDLENAGQYNSVNYASHALTARVYLQMGNYQESRSYADMVISSRKYSLEPEYWNIFNRIEPSNEDIFVAKISYPHEFNLMAASFSSSDYGFYGDIEILDGHLKHYAGGDKRAYLFYTGDGVVRCGKWINPWGCVNLIRLAEMYLIRAECNLRLGPPFVGASPVNDYNAIHTRAGFPPVSSVTLDDILLERRLELAFEGHRIHDIKRLKQNVGTLPYNSPRLVFPIPAREIETNPALVGQQNPGY